MEKKTGVSQKQQPKTLDNQREHDLTTVEADDEEALEDEASDEFAPYFNRSTSPKIFITTSDKARKRTITFAMK